MGSVLEKIRHLRMKREKRENPNHLDSREPVRQKEIKRRVRELMMPPKNCSSLRSISEQDLMGFELWTLPHDDKSNRFQ